MKETELLRKPSSPTASAAQLQSDSEGQSMMPPELLMTSEQEQCTTDATNATITAPHSRAVSDGPYGWTSAYDTIVEENDVVISVKVKVNRDADVTARQEANTKAATSNEFLRFYDSRFTLTDDCGVARNLKVQLDYVNSGEHLTIALHKGDGRDNLSNWFVGSDNVTRAHEMGHQLGFKDEYIDATVPNRATAASPGITTDNSIMGNYYTQGIDKADVRMRHGTEMASDVSNATGMNFTASWSSTYTVRAGDTLWNIALRIYGDGKKWKDIYELNKDQISDPDRIATNIVIDLPPRS